jgi:hypothetical protein
LDRGHSFSAIATPHESNLTCTDGFTLFEFLFSDQVLAIFSQVQYLQVFFHSEQAESQVRLFGSGQH